MKPIAPAIPDVRPLFYLSEPVEHITVDSKKLESGS